MASMAAPPMLPPEPIDADRYGNTAFIIIQAVLVATSTALVFARLYVRQFFLHTLGIDDLLIVVALIFSISFLAVTGVMIHQRVASVANGPPLYVPEILVALKWQSVSQPLSILSVTFTRISICAFLLRIFRTDRKWRWGLYSIAVFSAVTGIATAVLTVTQCRPVRKLWYPLTPGTCWSPKTTLAIGDFQGAVAVLVDWVLASLPIVFMWNVQLGKRIKGCIVVLMGMGYFTGICTIIKTVLLGNVINKTGDGSVTWGLVNLAIWVVLEENIGIIAASIPTLRPLFSKSMRESRKSGRSSSRYFGRSGQHRYNRKTSVESASRQLDDKSGLGQVELETVQGTASTSEGGSCDKKANNSASTFPPDDDSFESTRRGTDHSPKRHHDGGFYEHEEEIVDRV